MGVNTNGAAAEVIDFDRLGEKVRPGTFGKIEVGKREYTKSPSVEKTQVAVTPLVRTPFVQFRSRHTKMMIFCVLSLTYFYIPKSSRAHLFP